MARQAARPLPDAAALERFERTVVQRGRELYRDLPWRRTRDPYAIWVSEAMLQQTQVSRVDGRWQAWLERFPTPCALAQADTADVLAQWQGRRAGARRGGGPPRPAGGRAGYRGGHSRLRP